MPAPVYIFAGIAAFIVGGFVVSLIYERRRTAHLVRVAEELGFRYSPVAGREVLGLTSEFELMQRGRGKKAFNVLYKGTEHAEVAVFDYKYTVGSGKNSHTHNQTVVAIRSPDLQLPNFSLAPEGFMSRIAEKFGFQDIDFPEAPLFSKAFVLKGPNEAEIRQALGGAELERIAAFKGISLQANGNRILVWYNAKRSSADQIRKLFETAFEIQMILKT